MAPGVNKMSSLLLNDPATVSKVSFPVVSIAAPPATVAAGGGAVSNSISSKLVLTAPRQVTGAPPMYYEMYSSSETGGGLQKDHLQIYGYSNDGAYGAGRGIQSIMDAYPTPQGAGICNINLGMLDPARAGAITIAAGGTATIACTSTTAYSRLILCYIGGAAGAIAAATFVRTPGTGFTVTGTAAAQYHYLIIN